MALTGSLRNMAGRAAMRARVRQEATTYEASMIDERSECASIHPPRSAHNEESRPPTRRAVPDITIPETDFKGFSQVVAIPTPAASPTRNRHNSDAASIGPRSIRDIQFLTTSQEQPQQEQHQNPTPQPQPRLYSLHNPDQHVSPTEPQPTTQAHTINQPIPALALASPTFSETTISTSTTEGNEIGTPSSINALTAPYVDVSDDDVAAQLRWGQDPNQQNYKLPRDSVLLGDEPKPTTTLEVTTRSRVEAIFCELGYLGQSIR
jgi:hypothetical protein